MPLDPNLKSGDPWVFDLEVAENFSEYFARSVPSLYQLRLYAAVLAGRFIRPGMSMVDLGCARGQMINDVLSRFHVEHQGVLRCYGIDSSEPMCELARADLAGFPGVEIAYRRIEQLGFGGAEPVSLVTSIMSLSFVPRNHWPAVMRHAYDRLEPGGAFLVADKVACRDAGLNELFTDEHRSFKRSRGFTLEDILRKEASLRGVMEPPSSLQLETHLSYAGFESVECFWRCLNFGGWIAVKEGVLRNMGKTGRKSPRGRKGMGKKPSKPVKYGK